MTISLEFSETKGNFPFICTIHPLPDLPVSVANKCTVISVIISEICANTNEGLVFFRYVLKLTVNTVLTGDLLLKIERTVPLDSYSN